jgi:hypothetical protein
MKMNTELISDIIKLKLKTAEAFIDCLPQQLSEPASKLNREIISTIHTATAESTSSKSSGSSKIDID